MKGEKKAEPLKGIWLIHEKRPGEYQCSKCYTWQISASNFCPNCGKLMNMKSFQTSNNLKPLNSKDKTDVVCAKQKNIHAFPIELKDLKKMNGKPVYCVGTINHPSIDAWGIVFSCQDNNHSHVMTFLNNGVKACWFDTYMLEWMAFLSEDDAINYLSSV